MPGRNRSRAKLSAAHLRELERRWIMAPARSVHRRHNQRAYRRALARMKEQRA